MTRSPSWKAFGAFPFSEQMTFLFSVRLGTSYLQINPQNIDIKFHLNQNSCLVLFGVLQELRVPMPLLP